jgi:hypothetical protein
MSPRLEKLPTEWAKAVAPAHRKIQFESVDVMRVQNGMITDHWQVGGLDSTAVSLNNCPRLRESASPSGCL